MKVRDAEILILPGRGNAGSGHWQARWQKKLSTARRVEQSDWNVPVRADWTARIAAAVNAARRPVVLVAHALGVAAGVQAVPDFRRAVAGAFLVAPPDLSGEQEASPARSGFGPYPTDPLPFPSILIASRTDPHCRFAVAEEIAADWGSLFIDAGDAGHLDAASGHGPWPEGSMVFARFMSRL